MAPREKLPSFFKIVPGEEFTNKLEIPTEFVQHFLGNVPQQCRLQTASQTCLVQVEEVTNKFYFQTGWNDFLQRNRLKYGQLLVFHYAGYSHFHVDIFGLDTCGGDLFVGYDTEEPEEEDDGEDDDVSPEILDDSPMPSTLPRKKHQASLSGETSMKKRETQRSKSEMKKNHKNGDDDDDDDEEEEEEEEEGDDESEDEEDTEDEMEENDDDEREDDKETADEMAEEQDDDFSVSLNYVPPHSRTVASRLQKRRRSRKTSSDGGFSIYEKRLSSLALEKANGFNSDHPSFVVPLCTSYAGGSYLNIPRTFYEKHVAKQLPDHFTLWIQRTKKSFRVKVKYTRRTTRLQAGWPKFARVNKLKMGDVCVFVLTDAKRFVFDVEIIRLTDASTSSQGKGKQRMTDSTQESKTVIQIE